MPWRNICDLPKAISRKSEIEAWHLLNLFTTEEQDTFDAWMLLLRPILPISPRSFLGPPTSSAAPPTLPTTRRVVREDNQEAAPVAKRSNATPPTLPLKLLSRLN